ncbi:hypothetical protein A6R68_14071, partial [Neotoma lepida]
DLHGPKEAACQKRTVTTLNRKCRTESPHKVATIISFCNREEHLKYWLYYLCTVLQCQWLDYGVYVVNKAGDTKFNHAKRLTVGFREALKEHGYHCFVLSDVDLIPMDDCNAYRCFSQPQHISVTSLALYYSAVVAMATGGKVHDGNLLWKKYGQRHLPKPQSAVSNIRRINPAGET